MPRDPLRSAQRLLKRIQKCNRQCIAGTGNIDPAMIADLIQAALNDDIEHRGLLLAISEYLGSAIEGDVIDLETWQPLEHYPEAVRR